MSSKHSKSSKRGKKRSDSVNLPISLHGPGDIHFPHVDGGQGRNPPPPPPPGTHGAGPPPPRPPPGRGEVGPPPPPNQSQPFGDPYEKHDPYSELPDGISPDPLDLLPHQIPLPESHSGSSKISRRSHHSRRSRSSGRVEYPPPLPADYAPIRERRQSESGRSKRSGAAPKATKELGKKKPPGKGKRKGNVNGKKLKPTAPNPFFMPVDVARPSASKHSDSVRSNRSRRSSKSRKKNEMPPPPPPPPPPKDRGLPYHGGVVYEPFLGHERPSLPRSTSQNEKGRTRRSSSVKDRHRSKRKEFAETSSSSSISSGPSRRARDSDGHKRSHSRARRTEERLKPRQSRSRERRHRRESSHYSVDYRHRTNKKRQRKADDSRKRSKSSGRHHRSSKGSSTGDDRESDESSSSDSSSRPPSRHRHSRHEDDLRNLERKMEQLERKNNRLRRLRSEGDIPDRAKRARPSKSKDNREKHKRRTRHQSRRLEEDVSSDRRHSKPHKSPKHTSSSWKSQAKDIFYEESNKRRFRDLLTTSHDFRQQYKKWYDVAGDLLPYKPPKRRRR